MKGFRVFANSARSASRQYSTANGAPKSFLRTHSKKILWTIVIGGGAFTSYAIYVSRHPLPQFPHDEKKKNLIILGSGWASTTILKELDTEHFNVTVVSPRNYFLFTPLLPSCTVGTLDLRSIMEPLRYICRHKTREVKVVEAECTKVDPVNKTIVCRDNSDNVGLVSEQTLKYDYLIVACGAENATFGIPGVKENSCFLKEIWDARKIRSKLMDTIETAAFPGQPEKEIERLLHMVVVGGGPTGVEYAGELHDFLKDDLVDWYPEIADKFKITLVEALPHVLPMFSKNLIEYTEQTFTENKVKILSKTKVKEVKPKELVVENAEGKMITIPYGLLVWATGNATRPVVSDLIKQLPANLQNQRRGLVVDDHLRVLGAPNMFALGDASATKYPATAQVANRQGIYLAKQLNVIGRMTDSEKYDQKSVEEAVNSLPGFEHQSSGMLAYIGSDKAIADLPGGIKLGGMLTYYFWRSAYLSNLFSARNKFLVASDWLKNTIFGRDIGRE